MTELRSLFRGQWANGMVPADRLRQRSVALGAYEPRHTTWGTAGLCPPSVPTSGICQPPVHAIALARVRAIAAARTTARRSPRSIAPWPTSTPAWPPGTAGCTPARDPDGTGLVTVFHPWESGLDNSPRWDDALANVPMLVESPGSRPDLAHVADASERPTDDEYRRYFTLVRELVEVGYDPARSHRTHPFRMADVLFTAILAAADDELADLAVVAGQPAAADRHRADAELSRRGLDACWDPDRCACVDRDLVADRWVSADTIAGFAPLVAGCDGDRSEALARPAAGPQLRRAPSRCVWAVPPTTAVDDPAFDRRSYWRGPTWPVITWLLWWALERDGHHAPADSAAHRGAVAQLRDSGCSEYADPIAGEALGSAAQSWTAAVALDWLAHDPVAAADLVS